MKAVELSDTAEMARLRSSGKPAAMHRVLGGERLAYVSMRGASSELWSMEPGGGPPEKATELGGRLRNPSWSPTGTWIAFDADFEGTRQIYRVDANGAGLTRLSDGTAPSKSPAFSKPESEP